MGTPPSVEIGSTWNGGIRTRQRQQPGLEAHAAAAHVRDARLPRRKFRTPWLNHQSREVIARLGAKQDGVLRSHTRISD